MKDGDTITFTVRNTATEGFSEIFGVIAGIETPAAYTEGSTTEIVAVFSATGIPALVAHKSRSRVVALVPTMHQALMWQPETFGNFVSLKQLRSLATVN